MAETNLYDVLGVPSDASQDEIKQAFRSKAKRLHPDSGGGKNQFTDLTNAYNVLRDPKKRATYDRNGATSESPEATRSGIIAELICGAFVAVLDGPNFDPAKNDPVAETRTLIVGAIGKIEDERRKTALRRQRMSAVLNRLKRRNNDSRDPLAYMLREHIAGLVKRAASLTVDIDYHQGALAEIDDYSWTGGGSEPQQVQMRIRQRVSSTTTSSIFQFGSSR